MEQFIKQYKPKDAVEKPIDPRQLQVGPNGLTLCKVFPRIVLSVEIIPHLFKKKIK